MASSTFVYDRLLLIQTLCVLGTIVTIHLGSPLRLAASVLLFLVPILFASHLLALATRAVRPQYDAVALLALRSVIGMAFAVVGACALFTYDRGWRLLVGFCPLAFGGMQAINDARRMHHSLRLLQTKQQPDEDPTGR